MPFPLIGHLRDLVDPGPRRRRRFWPSETVGSGAAARPASVADLENMVIFPKLYRRLVDFFTDNHTDLAAFDTWIRAQPDRDDPAQLPAANAATSTTSTRSTTAASACATSPKKSSSSNRPSDMPTSGLQAGARRSSGERTVAPLPEKRLSLRWIRSLSKTNSVPDRHFPQMHAGHTTKITKSPGLVRRQEVGVWLTVMNAVADNLAPGILRLRICQLPPRGF